VAAGRVSGEEGGKKLSSLALSFSLSLSLAPYSNWNRSVKVVWVTPKRSTHQSCYQPPPPLLLTPTTTVTRQVAAGRVSGEEESKKLGELLKKLLSFLQDAAGPTPSSSSSASLELSDTKVYEP